MTRGNRSRYGVNTMTRRVWPVRMIGALLLLLLPGCALVQGFFALFGPPATTKPRSPLRASAVERLMPQVRPDFDRLVQDAQNHVLAANDKVDAVPARFKRRLGLDALRQPWEGLTNMEGYGLLITELAEGKAVNLPGLLDVLEAGMDRTSTFHRAIPFPTGINTKVLTTFIVDNLAEASQHREKAVSQLSDDERKFLFSHARSFAEHYTPQISNPTEQVMSRTKDDVRFAELIEQHVDYANLIAAGQVLARLANERWLAQLAGALSKPLPSEKVPAGVTGDVLYVENSSYGLVVIGGTGPNTYELDNRFGVLIDLGGDDLYRGAIAASTDIDHGNAVVIDAGGNDTYSGSPLGLATGRLGVGLLIDQAGDDVYQLATGSGGTGFGGLGILYDAKGHDVYMGSRLTQGAAIGGLGLLFDATGNDRYTSHGFAIGFGGPSGVGGVIDLEGDDQYQCGEKYASAFNTQDTPKGKPGDPLFQYDCFGLGTGSGARVLSKRVDWQAQSLAGGWGLLIDVKGNDHYRSANFSQAHGYFFGAGLLLDLSGNDEFEAARYGHAASAHYGVALLIDRQGDDHYGSSGPFYNGGVAWDRGVSMMIDVGNGNDRYGFGQSTGMGGADQGGWGLFIEEGGSDEYEAKSGFGRTPDASVAGFFDLNGKDGYRLSSPLPVPQDQQPADGKVILYPTGGVFTDR